MRISDHLIEQFFAGGGTEEERAEVREFLNNHPGKLAQYLTEESWESFAMDAGGPMAGKTNGLADSIPSDRLREAIEARVGVPRPTLIRRIGVRRMTAAAAVLVICVGAWSYWRLGRKAVGGSKQATELAEGLASKGVKSALVQSLSNNSARSRNYLLPDGSKVRLGAHSSVAFSQPFLNNRRDLFLTGDAVFNVVRDKVRPFAVHAKGTVTTVLGTVFGVYAKNDRVTTVQLYSGKVVVNKDDPQGKAFSPVYLVPGQQLILQNNNFFAEIKKIEPGVAVVKTPVLQPVLQFKKEPLSTIFSELQTTCHSTLIYDSVSMKTIEFTGNFDKNKESLESFLNTLCSLNELELVKTDSSHFSIKTK